MRFSVIVTLYLIPIVTRFKNPLEKILEILLSAAHLIFQAFGFKFVPSEPNLLLSLINVVA